MAPPSPAIVDIIQPSRATINLDTARPTINIDTNQCIAQLSSSGEVSHKIVSGSNTPGLYDGDYTGTKKIVLPDNDTQPLLYHVEMGTSNNGNILQQHQYNMLYQGGSDSQTDQFTDVSGNAEDTILSSKRALLINFDSQNGNIKPKAVPVLEVFQKAQFGDLEPRVSRPTKLQLRNTACPASPQPHSAGLRELQVMAAAPHLKYASQESG